ncbi:MAG: hypothetical protein C0523_06205, partial [Cytophaga sp.]|nr:hypothetical protein [Cytophaga sp.]
MENGEGPHLLVIKRVDMKTILFSTIILLAAVQLVGQHPSFQLPKVWDETVVISLAYTGSMSGAESHFTFTYDSCNYQVTSLHTKEEKKSFLLSAKDR